MQNAKCKMQNAKCNTREAHGACHAERSEASMPGFGHFGVLGVDVLCAGL
jgi:hypothetical protein